MFPPTTDYTSIPCRVVLEGNPLGPNMDDTTREVRRWVEHEFGEVPEDISVWAEEDEIVQVLIRLSDKVVISDLTWQDEEILEEASLVIRLSNWKPNSIQTRRMPDGLVRFKHRSNEIMLAAKVRAPEWAAALLEEWLMSMKGREIVPKGRAHQISDLKRRRDKLSKTLEQADLASIRGELKIIENRLNSADDRLSGKKA
ncbi:MAG: hypothetical protein DWC02_04925 [Candidatus Poseidoniales archaeon]|nr:MAG: hypothetical protein DWC02_04925 [Candidatus Poseidoniales archaeon]